MGRKTVFDDLKDVVVEDHPWISTSSAIAAFAIGAGKIALGGATLLTGGAFGLAAGAGVATLGIAWNAAEASYHNPNGYVAAAARNMNFGKYRTPFKPLHA